MKILVLGDPHGKLPKNLDSLIERNKVELIICTGDWAFTPKKPWLEKSWKNVKTSFVRKTAREVIKKIISFKIPVLTLKGNMFMSSKGKKFADRLVKNKINLIQKYNGKTKIDGQGFVFFDVIYEKHNLRKKNEITIKMMKKNKIREKKLKKLLKENPDSILITHNPPYGYVDKTYEGKHVGSKIILNAIKKYQPKMVLCGHIHEAKGKAKIGKTIVYNLGWHGDYLLLDID